MGFTLTFAKKRLSMQQDTEFELFRDNYRRFLKEYVAPHYEQWEQDGLIPRRLWNLLGENGFLCVDVPEKYAVMVPLYTIL